MQDTSKETVTFSNNRVVLSLPMRDRGLYSFPTRRSSDLIHYARLLALVIDTIQLFGPANTVFGAVFRRSQPSQASKLSILPRRFRRDQASLRERRDFSLRSEEHTSELQSRGQLECHILLVI